MRAGLSDRGADAGDAGRRAQCFHRESGPHGRQRLSLLRRRLPAHLSHQGRQACLRHRPQRTGQREPALRQGPLRLRLHPQSAAAFKADDPQGRRAQDSARTDRPVEPLDAFPRGDLGGGARPRRRRLEENPRPRRAAGARRFRLGQGIERRSLPISEARSHRLRHQQCRSLHAAVPRFIGCRIDGGRRLGRRVGDLQRVQEFGGHFRDRGEPDRKPPRRRDLFQSGGQARFDADRRRSARAGAQTSRHPHAAIQAGHGRCFAQWHAQYHRRRKTLRRAIHSDLRRGFQTIRRQHQGLHARGDGADLRHRSRHHPHRGAQIRPRQSGDHFLGHGNLPAHPRHRQCALPDRTVADYRTDRPAGHRAASFTRQNNVQGASDAGLIPMFFPDYKSVEDPQTRARYEAAWGTKLDPKKGLTVVEIMDAVHADVIKGMYIMGENPAMSDPDLNHARQALAHLEHLVVQDLFLTETAVYADVVLPASAWPEKDGTVTNTNRQVQMGRQALPLPGEAKPDWWLIQEIGRRIGLPWNYKHPSELYTEMASLMPSLDNISWDRIERESAVTYPSDAPDQPGHDVVFEKGFPRPGGFGKLVAAKLTPPDEQPDVEYPFILTTGRQLEHWHTGAMTRRATTLDALEPGPVANLSRGTIAKLGITPGDPVRVTTRRGVVELTARQDDGVPDGVVFIPFAFVEAAANLLTNPALDPFGKIPEFKFCAAKVERIDEATRVAAE